MQYDAMTIPQLKELADSMGVKYASKTRKIDLIRAIDDATMILAGARDAYDDEIDRASAEMFDEAERAQITRDRINRKRNRQTTERKIVRTLRASGSKHYGIGGRGMGAKHYASRTNPQPVPWVRPVVLAAGIGGGR